VLGTSSSKLEDNCQCYQGLVFMNEHKSNDCQWAGQLSGREWSNPVSKNRYNESSDERVNVKEKDLTFALIDIEAQ
jgi:hypothetical protein